MDSYKSLASYYDMLISDDDAQELYLDFTLKHMIGNEILELGCGSGILADKLIRSNDKINMVATDLSDEMIEVAKENYSLNQVEFKVMNMCENVYNNQFDTVLCYCDSLNYVLGIENIRKVFLGAYNALKDEGVFI